MNAFSTTSIITFFLILGLSGVVFLHKPRTRANIFFVLFGFAGSFWVFSNFMANISESPGLALFWSQSAIIGPAFFPIFLQAFVVELYLEKFNFNSWYKKLLPVYMFLSISIILFGYTSLNITNVTIEDWGTDFTPGPLYYLLFLYLFVGFIRVFLSLFKIHKSVREPYKSQTKFILIGTATTFSISVIANIILPLIGHGEASLFGPPSVVFFVGFSAYAILKHHLFDIKLIAVESLSLVISLIFFIRIFLSSGQEQVVNIALFLFVSGFSLLLVRSIMKDVKDRERVEALSYDLIVANEQLRRMDQQKSDFVSIASHQLRTPLTAVKGYASLLLEGSFGEIPQKTMGAISKIFESSQQMVMVIENFLTISRIEQGRMFYKFETLDLQKITHDMVTEMRVVASGYGITIRFYEEKETKYLISGDFMKIKQAIHNLLDESIKHTPKGLIDIFLSFSQYGDHVVLAISDTGEGATQKHLKHMFDKDEVDVSENELRKETGVELFIVKEIVKAHHGRVWAESEGIGKGMTMFVELPTIKSL